MAKIKTGYSMVFVGILDEEETDNKKFWEDILAHFPLK
jgi:hypothetical protein